MALFGGKKKKDNEQGVEREVQNVKRETKNAKRDTRATQRSARGAPSTAPDALLRPHITEKAAQATARRVYTFDIRPDATKRDVARAVEAVYRVKPMKIGIVKTIGKRVRLRTRRGYGTKNASKKAYVYLKKGDRIEFAS